MNNPRFLINSYCPNAHEKWFNKTFLVGGSGPVAHSYQLWPSAEAPIWDVNAGEHGRVLSSSVCSSVWLMKEKGTGWGEGGGCLQQVAACIQTRQWSHPLYVPVVVWRGQIEVWPLLSYYTQCFQWRLECEFLCMKVHFIRKRTIRWFGL